MKPSDAELVQRTLAGDVEAFGELVARHQNAVFNAARRWVNGHADAEDIAQETFLRAYERLATLREHEKFAGWLCGIAANLAKMWQRAQRQTRAHEILFTEGDFADLSTEADATPAAEWERIAERDVVMEAVNHLPEKSRDALLLHYRDGHSQKEIAQRLGLSITAVENRIHRAKRRLQEELMKMTKIRNPKSPTGRDSRQVPAPPRTPRIGAGAEIRNRKQLGADFTERVKQAVLKQHEQTVVERVTAEPGVPVFIYGGLPRVRIALSSGAGDEVRVTARKTLLGQTQREAKSRIGQVQVRAERRRDLLTSAPSDGEAWVGTGGLEKPFAYYAPHRGRWEAVKRAWQEQDAEGYASVQNLLSREVAAVLITGERMDGIALSAPLNEETLRALSPAMTHIIDGKGYVFGPAGGADVTVQAPAGREVIIVSEGEVEVSDFEGNVALFGLFIRLFSHQVKGNLRLCGGATPVHVEDVMGDVDVRVHEYGQGTQWGDPVRRVGDVPSAHLRGITGNVGLFCKKLNLELSGVSGSVRVENLFGTTKVDIAQRHEGTRYEVRSVAGDIEVTFSSEADEKLRTHVLTECGSVDRQGWRETPFFHGTPTEIFMGTVPRHEEVDALITTQCGDIRVVRQG